MHEVIMPKLGLTMESGTIEKWHKKEGDKVKKGDVLFEVMTDKVTIEVESYYKGYLRKILKGEGEEVPVSGVVAYIGEKDEKIPAGKKVEKEEVKPREASRKHEAGRKGDEDKEGTQKGAPEKRIRISPLARRTAGELGIDYRTEKIKGSGSGGRIEKKDIISFSRKKKKGEEKKEIDSKAEIKIKSSSELKGMRKSIAGRMSYSSSSIPHILLNAKANVYLLTELKNRLEKKLLKEFDIKITYTDLILKAAALALRDNPGLNSTYSDGKYIIYEDINVGMAISIRGGLIVPTFFNCDRLKIGDIAKTRIELVEKARKGNITRQDVSGGTFTVTNLGMYGVRSFSPIINPPQAAILAVGEIYTEPSMVGKEIKQQSFMDISVSCDHRIVDGKAGAEFLQGLVKLLEDPSELID
ncbi:MAG: dihydrolipoamide acetyltransferase family protein [Actinomycetota bacterium]|nr:dihydrolipoamide acetyltransferase family protein [Actinomycetota bacterium]